MHLNSIGKIIGVRQFAFVIALGSIISASAQPRICNQITIQNITLQDTFLTQQIKKLIVDLENTDSLFKRGIGYLHLHTVIPKEIGAVRAYHIFPNSSSLDIEHDEQFPSYYTIVETRPVLIYLNIFEGIACRSFSKQSKKKLTRVIEPYLTKKTNVKARDGARGIKDFREEFFYGHGSGKVITYFLNRLPEVRQSTYTD